MSTWPWPKLSSSAFSLKSKPEDFASPQPEPAKTAKTTKTALLLNRLFHALHPDDATLFSSEFHAVAATGTGLQCTNGICHAFRRILIWFSTERTTEFTISIANHFTNASSEGSKKEVRPTSHIGAVKKSTFAELQNTSNQLSKAFKSYTPCAPRSTRLIAFEEASAP